MTAKPVVPRIVARSDIEDAIESYLVQGGERGAAGFIDAVEGAYKLISIRPKIGSPLFAQILGLPGLRSRPVKRFPYLIFYYELDDHIDVWRVLHTRRDIPASIGASLA